MVNQRIGELVQICAEINCDHFHVFCTLSGHIDQIEIRVHGNGWSESDDSQSHFWLLSYDCTDEQLSDIAAELEYARAASDKRNSPEGKAETAEQLRIDEINRLKARLAELEV